MLGIHFARSEQFFNQVSNAVVLLPCLGCIRLAQRVDILYLFRERSRLKLPREGDPLLDERVDRASARCARFSNEPIRL